ncbi:MAG: ATP-binding protein [Clostridiales bacterium]|nr:ATP-binding protein [Clostridiales bacterium]MCF8023525.1 ATP-binding protein [Clostridiales bacterium]
MTLNAYHQNFYRIYTTSGSLLLYRNLLQDSLINKMRGLLFSLSRGESTSKTTGTFYELCHLLIKAAEKKGLSGNLWQEYIIFLIAEDENTFSRTAERESDKINSSLYNAAAHDLYILKEFSGINIPEMAALLEENTPYYLEEFQSITSSTVNNYYHHMLVDFKNSFTGDGFTGNIVNSIARFYKQAGCGKFGYYSAFQWKNSLVGIEYPDPVKLEDLVGCSRQKQLVIKNTEAFINSKPANNLLLYGERGTGKSSTVKALANEYFASSLRLVEVPKHQLPYLPEILRDLRGHAQHFIIFIDDLSFEESETDYKYMKALMEGGVEVPPENVLLYATSNRRHLVQENWSDLEDRGEKHIMDAVQEKLSLSDRFGITITYTSPDQEEYLYIVENLARKSGINISEHELREKALQWEKWHNARSGRTARQFIDHLLGQFNTEYKNSSYS